MADYIPTPHELRTAGGTYGRQLKEAMDAAKLDPKHCVVHVPHEFYDAWPTDDIFSKGLLGMPLMSFNDPSITYFLVERRKDGAEIKVRFKARGYEEQRTVRSVPDHVQSIYLDDRVEVCRMDRPGPGGASHAYEIFTADDSLGRPLCRIHFQEGPADEVGINGVQEEALVAIVIDRLKAFLEKRPRDYNMAMTKLRLEEALILMKAGPKSSKED